MREIKVTELRVGMTILENGGRSKTPVKSLTPCTQRRKVHVNKKDCYDYIGSVTVA